jgi:hypothetical protein
MESADCWTAHDALPVIFSNGNSLKIQKAKIFIRRRGLAKMYRFFNGRSQSSNLVERLLPLNQHSAIFTAASLAMSFPRLSLSPTEVDVRRRSSRLVGSSQTQQQPFGLSSKPVVWEDSDESEPDSEPLQPPPAVAPPRPSKALSQAQVKSKPVAAKSKPQPPPALPPGGKPAKGKAYAAAAALKTTAHPEPGDSAVIGFRVAYGKRASEQPRAPLQLRTATSKIIAKRSPKQQLECGATSSRLSRASERRQPAATTAIAIATAGAGAQALARQASVAAPRVAAKTGRATASTRHPRQASMRRVDYREEDSERDKSTSDIESVDFDLSIPVRGPLKRGASDRDRDSNSDSDTIATAAASNRRLTKRRVAQVPEEDDEDDEEIVMTNVLENAKEYWAEIDSIPTAEFEVVAKEDKWKYI